jgi:large subunit ribosomal protein L23
MKEPASVLIRPMATEKTEKLKDKNNQYTFLVSTSANKIEIRYAVEKAFDLKDKVLNVQTINCNGKYRRSRRRFLGGYRRDWKKAVVTLVKGATIKGLTNN